MVSLYVRTSGFFRNIGYIFIIKESCHLESMMPKHMPFKILDISSNSRDMRENRKRSVCMAAILDFPAKQDIVLKNQRIVSPST